MIQLFINQHEIVLERDFSINIVEENPLITRNGEYTLDFDISLLEPRNAVAFGFINRLNINSIPTSFEAVMIIDLKAKNGKFIVLNISNTTVKGQFVSNNSELNYITGDDRKIWDFDWGTLEAITPEIARTSLNIIGYQNYRDGATGQHHKNSYVCAPLMAGEVILNDFRLDWWNNINVKYKNVDTEVPLASMQFYTLTSAIEAMYYKYSVIEDRYFSKILFKINTNETVCYIYNKIGGTITDWRNVANWEKIEYRFLAQPYILYYIDKLPLLLGYTLSNNILKYDDFAKKLFMTNTIDSINFADFLPDITVAEFITNVENFFNVAFVVDNTNKSIEIKRIVETIENQPVVELKNVLDSVEIEISNTESDNRLSVENLSYDVSGTDYFKIHKIPQDVLSKFEIKEFADFAAIDAYTEANPEFTRKPIIYTDLETNQDYLAQFYQFTDGSGYFSKWLKRINKLKNANNNENILELKIKPASIAFNKMYYNRNDTIDNEEIQMPETTDSYNKNEAKTAYQLILMNDSIKRNSEIKVAFYDGLIPFVNFTIIKYPFTKIDKYYEYNSKISDDYLYSASNHPTNTGEETLVLKNLFDSVYKVLSQNNVQYKFVIVDSPVLSINNVFEYNGARYIPVKFERTISNKKNPVTGYFLKMV